MGRNGRSRSEVTIQDGVGLGGSEEDEVISRVHVTKCIVIVAGSYVVKHTVKLN